MVEVPFHASQSYIVEYVGKYLLCTQVLHLIVKIIGTVSVNPAVLFAKLPRF